MKKVLNADNVAHTWANQQQNEARTPNNSFYFYNDTIYSYGSHFPIAKHTTNSKGETAILFTTRSYSNTTSKHIYTVKRSIPNKENIIYCNNPANSSNDNILFWDREIDNIYRALAKAKKPSKYLLELSHLKAQILEYCNFMEVEIPQAISLKLDITSKAEIVEIVEKEKAIKAEIEAKKEKEKEQETKKQLKKFRAFERFNLYSKFSYLRYNEATQRIETSQRIEIPLEIAKRLYKAIKTALIDINNPTQEILENLNVLTYKVKNIQKDFIEIGCHKIEMKEINKIAKSLNF
jgi:hypothetical protein